MFTLLASSNSNHCCFFRTPIESPGRLPGTPPHGVLGDGWWVEGSVMVIVYRIMICVSILLVCHFFWIQESDFLMWWSLSNICPISNGLTFLFDIFCSNLLLEESWIQWKLYFSETVKESESFGCFGLFVCGDRMLFVMFTNGSRFKALKMDEDPRCVLDIAALEVAMSFLFFLCKKYHARWVWYHFCRSIHTENASIC